jgi:DNA-binding NarL/FixJ family response regulator
VSGDRVRVLLADAHPVCRHGLRALLDGRADFAVVGEAADATATLHAAGALAPHVVITDLPRPPAAGITTISELRRAHPETGVLIMDTDGDDDLLVAALRAGARGYLRKDASAAAILAGLHAVARGEAVFGAGVAARLLGLFAAARPPAPFAQLTSREHDILELVARGLDNHAIARRLCLAPKTVANRVADICAKLRAPSRARAVALARDAGLGSGA